MKQYIFPKAIVAAPREGNGCSLLKRKSLQIGLAEHDVATLQQGQYVILDFGTEICGGVRILTFHGANVPVRIRFGESLTECCAELGGAQNATNDHSLRDLTVHLQNYADMSFGQTGFRFVRLDFGGTVTLKSVVAESYLLKKPLKYAYQGEDATVKRIFEVAKHTVDLCASRGYAWDGIKRDRLVWIGDMHPEMLALTTLYGRLAEIERSLDFVKEQTPLPGFMNGFPTYSMWWIIIVADYYERTGATAFAERQLPYLIDLLALMDTYVSADGTMHYPAYFVDWPTRGKPDELLGARAIHIMAVKRAIALLRAFDKPTEMAEALLKRLLLIGIYPESSKQVLGLKYAALGKLTDKEKEMLLSGGAKGLSTFMSYYILSAIASFDKAAAQRIMKDYYSAMLNKGATAFWEDFDTAWCEGSCRIDALPSPGEKDIHGDYGAHCYRGFRHSLCHGWSAGVISFIKETYEK